MKKNILIIITILIIFILMFVLIYFNFFNVKIKNTTEFKKVIENVNDIKINIIYSNGHNGNEKTICEITDENDIEYLYDIISRQRGKRISKKETIMGGAYFFEIINIKNNNSIKLNINQNHLSVGTKLYEVNENLTVLVNDIYKKYKNNDELI